MVGIRSEDYAGPLDGEKCCSPMSKDQESGKEQDKSAIYGYEAGVSKELTQKPILK